MAQSCTIYQMFSSTEPNKKRQCRNGSRVFTMGIISSFFANNPTWITLSRHAIFYFSIQYYACLFMCKCTTLSQAPKNTKRKYRRPTVGFRVHLTWYSLTERRQRRKDAGYSNIFYNSEESNTKHGHYSFYCDSLIRVIRSYRKTIIRYYCVSLCQ